MNKIEWCDKTINCVIGCSRGCEYCYARKINNRFNFVQDFSKPQFIKKRLYELDKVKNKIVFINSMSDYGEWDEEVFSDVCSSVLYNRECIFISLTKTFFYFQRAPKNHLQGFTVTRKKDFDNDGSYFFESDFSQHCDILNIEPILEDVDDCIHAEFLKRLSWCIIGAETGNRKGKIIPKREWIDKIIVKCRECGVPVFIKDSITKLYGINIKEYPQIVYDMGLRRLTHEKRNTANGL